MAELLVDGALFYALYRHLRRTDTGHGHTTAVIRTALPFALTAVFRGMVGLALAAYAPGAHTVGEVVYHANPERVR